ncbi:hypothetical protein [Photobacterium swingsii]|uniref:hypothetical protein n=1 Tax=Photobacterium swingsii TaxID=680026 RepID=UPI0040691EAB
MGIKKAHGFSTLLITVIISLIMALYVFSLLSVELFNSKKTQNVIISQELKSKSASGLQCAVDIILRSGQKPTSTSIDYAPCVDAVITAIQIPATSTYKVTSTATAGDAESTMSQLFMSSSMNGVKSAFSSSGDIVFNVSQTIDPYEGVKAGTGYNCSAIRSGGKVIIENGGDIVVRHPHDQNGHQKKDADKQLINCNSSHLTVSPKSSADYLGDIEENITDLDLFYDNFGMKRDSWAEAKNLFDTVITGEKRVETIEINQVSTDVEFLYVPGCGGKIQTIIDANQKEIDKVKVTPDYKPALTKYIWIDGTCSLNGMTYKQTADDAAGITVVIKDGLVTNGGSPTSFHGNLFVFDYSMTDAQLLAAWQTATVDEKANVANYDLSQMPFYFRGTFQTRGAFNLDSPNRQCRVEGSFQPGYSKGKVDYEESPFGKTVMLEGSWHDF